MILHPHYVWKRRTFFEIGSVIEDPWCGASIWTQTHSDVWTPRTVVGGLFGAATSRRPDN